VNKILPMIRGRLPFELKFLNAWPMFHAASFVYYIEFFLNDCLYRFYESLRA